MGHRSTTTDRDRSGGLKVNDYIRAGSGGSKVNDYRQGLGQMSIEAPHDIDIKQSDSPYAVGPELVDILYPYPGATPLNHIMKNLLLVPKMSVSLRQRKRGSPCLILTTTQNYVNRIE